MTLMAIELFYINRIDLGNGEWGIGRQGDGETRGWGEF